MAQPAVITFAPSTAWEIVGGLVWRIGFGDSILTTPYRTGTNVFDESHENSKQECKHIGKTVRVSAERISGGNVWWSQFQTQSYFPFTNTLLHFLLYFYKERHRELMSNTFRLELSRHNGSRTPTLLSPITSLTKNGYRLRLPGQLFIGCLKAKSSGEPQTEQ